MQWVRVIGLAVEGCPMGGRLFRLSIRRSVEYSEGIIDSERALVVLDALNPRAEFIHRHWLGLPALRDSRVCRGSLF